MEALDAGRKIVEFMEKEDCNTLFKKFIDIGNRFAEEGYEVGPLSITPFGPGVAGKKGIFYVWNPETRAGKFFLMMPENKVDEIEPFHEMEGSREYVEELKRCFLRFDELSFYNGEEKATEMLHAEEERKEAVKKEIAESAAEFKVFGGR